MFGTAGALVAGVSTPGAVAAAVQAADSGGFDYSQLLTAGVTPLAVLMLVLGNKLYPAGIVDTYKTRAKHAEDQLEVLQKRMLDDVVPALTNAATAVTTIAPYLALAATAGPVPGHPVFGSGGPTARGRPSPGRRW